MKYLMNVLLMALLAISMVGCGETSVKDSVLSSYPNATVGDALNGSFSNGTWTELTTKQNATVVEFRGTATESFQMSIEGIPLLIPKGEQVLVQFPVTADSGQFTVGYVEANCMFNLPKDSILALGLIMQGIEANTLESRSLNIEVFLDHLYN